MAAASSGAGRLRRIALPLAVGAAAILALVVLRLVFNPFTQSVPLCAFHALTGLYCPGCGATRAAYAVSIGDLALAVRSWAPILVIGPLAVGAWLWWAVARWRGVVPRLFVPWPLMATALSLLLVFGVVRNLPGFELLRLLSLAVAG